MQPKEPTTDDVRRKSRDARMNLNLKTTIRFQTPRNELTLKNHLKACGGLFKKKKKREHILATQVQFHSWPKRYIDQTIFLIKASGKRKRHSRIHI